MSEIEIQLEKIKNGFKKEIAAKLRRVITVQYEVLGENIWSIIINNKELKIIKEEMKNPSIKFTFRDSMSFLKYLRKEIKELRGWMNEYYIFEGSPRFLLIYNSIIGFPNPSQWQPQD